MSRHLHRGMFSLEQLLIELIRVEPGLAGSWSEGPLPGSTLLCCSSEEPAYIPQSLAWCHDLHSLLDIPGHGVSLGAGYPYIPVHFLPAVVGRLRACRGRCWSLFSWWSSPMYLVLCAVLGFRFQFITSSRSLKLLARSDFNTVLIGWFRLR